MLQKPLEGALKELQGIAQGKKDTGASDSFTLFPEIAKEMPYLWPFLNVFLLHG